MFLYSCCAPDTKITVHGMLAPSSRRVVVFAFALAVMIFGESAVLAQANAPGGQSLSRAQARLRDSQEELDSALAKVKSEEKRLRDAETSAERQRTKLEAEKAKVEKAKNDLAAAKARADQAQQKHDAASAEILRLYRESQRAPAPTRPQ
jgi:hypothetical protein